MQLWKMLAYMLRYRLNGVFSMPWLSTISSKKTLLFKTSRCVYIIQKKISFRLEFGNVSLMSWNHGLILFVLFVAMSNLSFIETGIILQTGLTGIRERGRTRTNTNRIIEQLLIQADFIYLPGIFYVLLSYSKKRTDIYCLSREI